MAFCFSGSLLRANINIVFSCLILLSFVANKFLLLLQHTTAACITETLPDTLICFASDGASMANTHCTNVLQV